MREKASLSYSPDDIVNLLVDLGKEVRWQEGWSGNEKPLQPVVSVGQWRSVGTEEPVRSLEKYPQSQQHSCVQHHVEGQHNPKSNKKRNL